MGFFKSNKEPQPPLPALFISLTSQEDTVFKPNDTVSGHLTLTTPLPITPQAIEVSLWGKSKTWIRTSTKRNNTTSYKHYRDDVSLFDVTSNLFPAPHLLSPEQTYIFPFSFRVPEGTGVNRSGCYEKDGDERWTVFPHKLPPTFL
ncbi:hypothetical protein K505DRAFT_254397, partial [Melanomma pulvis-pyrius CBS 109.77]